MKIVLDSDVIIAGLISPKGAGNFILKNYLSLKSIKICTSKQQLKEIQKVLKRPEFIWKPNLKLWKRFQKQTKKARIKENTLSQTKKFVTDPYDSPILTLAITSKAKFLLTYNLKHYLANKIKENFGILVISPGHFLQLQRATKQ